MATLNLSIPPGVVRGATPATTPGRWYDANLVRWHGGGLMPIGGWDRVTSSPLSTTPRFILPWADNSGIRRAAYACDLKLLIETSGEFFDATPAGFTGASVSLTTGGYGSNTYSYDDYGDARPNTIDVNANAYDFSLATWGQDILALFSSDGRLLRYTPSAPTTAASVVATAPAALRSMVVTDERHVMCVGGTNTPRRIQWSSREDYTDWNFASTVNTAGFIDVETDAALSSAVNVREGVLVFGESDVFLVRYVGLPFVYGVEKIATLAAPISPLAIALFDGRAAWMGREQFWIYDGGAVKPLTCDVQDWLYDTIDRDYARFYAAGSGNGVYPECWWFYPDADSNDGENNRYVIWNFAENWWSIGEMGRSCMAEAGVYRYPIAAGTDRNVYEHETGFLDAGAPRHDDVWAETSTISLGDGDRLMSVTRAQPDSTRGAARTSFTFKTQQAREGAETTFGPYTCRSDGYMDVRFSARDVRLRVTSLVDDNWTVGAMRLQAQPRGRR
jgi:hypothetical protein